MKPDFVRLFLLAIALLATGFANSATPQSTSGSVAVANFDSTSTLQDYVKLALQNNSRIKSLFYQWQESKAMAGSAGAPENPLLSYQYGYTKFSDPIGPDHQKFGLMQAIPWFGTLGARKNAALLNAESDYARLEGEQLSAVYRVKSAYYEYYFLGQQLALTRASFELMKQFEVVVRTRYESGLAMQPDLIKAQIELGTMEDMIRSMESMLAPAQAKLRAQMNLADTVSLPIPRTIDLDEANHRTDSMVAFAAEHSPTLVALRNQTDSRRAALSVAKKMSYPELMLGVEYERAKVSAGVDHTGAALEETMNDYMVEVQLSLPIWFGKNKAMRDEARAGISMSEQMHQDERNDLASMISMANFEYNDALRRLQLYRDGLLPKAKESLNATLTAYQTGQTDFLMLLDSQRQLLEFSLAVERAKVDAATKWAEIEMITGTNPNTDNSQQ